MNRFTIGISFLVLLSLVTAIGRTASYSIGKTSLSANVIELDNLTITATGNASLTIMPVSQTVASGTMLLDSMKADTIRIELARSPKKDLILKQAVATGNVVIKARRGDQETDENGKPVTVVRSVNATAQKAQFIRDENKVILSGAVYVKVFDPGSPHPIAELSGETVVYHLQENKIEIKGKSDKQPEVTVSPKGGE
jgi:lipopolysaccharide export system protein LptA